MISAYLPGTTILHRIGAGWKLIGLLAISMLLLPVGSPVVLAGALVLVLAVLASLGAGAATVLRSLKPLAAVVLFILLLHALFGTLDAGIVVALRLASLLLLATLITLTTRLDDMLDALTPVLRPAAFFGLSERRLALAIALSIRFTPMLIDVMHQLNEAYRARSGRNGHVRLVAPLCLHALNAADHIAEALAARGGADGCPPEGGAPKKDRSENDC